MHENRFLQQQASWSAFSCSKNIAQYRKTETKLLRQVVYLISGINPAWSKTLSRLPARLQGSAQKEPPVSEGNQKKENSSAKFRWPGLLFFNYT